MRFYLFIYFVDWNGDEDWDNIVEFLSNCFYLIVFFYRFFIPLSYNCWCQNYNTEEKSPIQLDIVYYSIHWP